MHEMENDIQNGWAKITKGRRKLIALGSNVFGLLLILVFLIAMNIGYSAGEAAFSYISLNNYSEVFSTMFFWGFIAFQQIIWICYFTYLHQKVGRIW
jgi:hypothetical protein